MLDVSSQLMLDNVAPQAKPGAAVASKPMNSNESSFSDHFNNANQNQVQSKPDNNSQNSQSRSDGSNQDDQSASVSKSEPKNTPEKTDKPEQASKSEQTAKSEHADKSDTSNKPDNTQKNDELKEQTAKLEDSDEAASLEQIEESELSNDALLSLTQIDEEKLNFQNPLQLQQQDKDPTKIIDELHESIDPQMALEDKAGKQQKESVQELIARILQSKDITQKHDAMQLNDDLDEGVEHSINASLVKAAELVKTVMPEVKDNNKLRDTIQKQVALMQQDKIASNDSGNLAEALGLEQELTLSDEKLDEFVSKVFDRLNMNKSNLETILAAKAGSEKAQINNEFIDQLSAKISTEINDKANPAATLLNTTAQRTNSLTPAQFTLNTHINQPEWGSEFGKRIQFMMNNNIKSAELRLDPPELGRINVKINLSNEQANVSFTSAHQSVREAIENTLPRLRELLAESGLQLGNTDVASQFQQHMQGRENSESNDNLAGPVLPEHEDVATDEDLPQITQSYSIDGVIDYFA